MSSADLPTPPRLRPAKRAAARRTLTRDAVVDAAMAILDEGGMDALNMRAVAERLGTGPASLYAHVEGKEELLALMIDRLAGDLPTPEVGNGPWQDQLKDAIRGIRSGLAAHRDLAQAALGNIPTGPNALRWINGLLGVLIDAGLPEHVIAYAVDVLPLYATATAYEESLYTPKEQSDPEQYFAELRRYWASLPVDRFPHIVALAEPLTSEAEPDARFEFGLDALVRGIESMAR